MSWKNCLKRGKLVKVLVHFLLRPVDFQIVKRISLKYDNVTKEPETTLKCFFQTSVTHKHSHTPFSPLIELDIEISILHNVVNVPKTTVENTCKKHFRVINIIRNSF